MEYDKKYGLAAKLITDGYLVHCTDAVFDRFDPSLIKGGSRAKEGYGFYFTDMPYKAIEYGENFKVIRQEDFNWLDSSKPIDKDMFYDDGLNTHIAKLENQLDNCRNVRDYDFLNAEIEKCKQMLENFDETLAIYVRMAIKEGARTYGNLEYLISNPKEMVPRLVKTYIRNGYDGYYTDHIFTVFNVEKLNEHVMDGNKLIRKYLENESRQRLPHLERRSE